MIHILYNPNSTGDGKQNAQALQAGLKAKNHPSQLVATKRAGHAIELAQVFAKKYPTGTLVSSSGDGGYHEIVQGVLAVDEVSKVKLGVLPSGNANDHYNFVHRGNVANNIAQQRVRKLDVLRVRCGDKTWYAHSYVGLGMTPQIGKELTKHSLNPVLESWIVVKHLLRVRPVKIHIDGTVQRYDSLVCSTIGKMSKYLTLSDDAQPDDGRFEVTRQKSGSTGSLLKHIAHIGLTKNHKPQQVRELTFTVLHKTLMQLDGEVYAVAAGQTVTITCLPGVLRSVT